MVFKSEVLKNTQLSQNYFDGDYKFDFLPYIIRTQYAITNTIENRIIGELKTDRFEKFTDLENLFIRFINFLNKNEFENLFGFELL